MVLTAMAVFLLPLAVASLGALVLGNLFAEKTYASLGRWQTLGAVAGFVIGALLAKLVVRLVGHRLARRQAGVS